MGKTIEAIAIERGHDIVLKAEEPANETIKKADVAIDFSIPSAAVDNISNCFNHGVPVISGTTGWLDQYDAMVNLCKKQNGAFIYASNFSLGVNIFFELNKSLAKIMSTLKDYSVDIEEIHHIQKLDAPSGTAISLAKDIIDNHANYSHWAITYKSNVDTIEIKHTAHNRQGFALGAIVAAEWLHGKKGVFTMKDVLSLND